MLPKKRRILAEEHLRLDLRAQPRDETDIAEVQGLPKGLVVPADV